MSDRQISKTAPAPGRQQVRLGTLVGSRGLPLLPPLNAILELAVFVVVVLAIDAFVPSFSLNSIEPNPSWLPVLLLSVQYGTVSGLLAAAVCIALSMQTGFPEQDVGENLFVYLLRAWAQPMLWLSAAVLLGQFRTRHIAERAELTQELATLSSQRTALADYANNLRARCDALERHLASRDAPEPVALLAELSRAAATAPADLPASFRSIVAAALPGAAASLVLIGPAGPRLLAAVTRDGLGPVGDDALVMSALPPALVAELEASRRVVSVLTAEGERLLDGRALIAVPVEASDRVVGLLLVYSLDSAALTAKLTSGLPVLAAALAPAVEASLLDGEVERSAARPQPVDTTVNAAPGAAHPWLERLWKSRASSVSPAAGPARPDPPTRRLVR